MSISQDMTSQFALDMQGFQRLQHTARMNPAEGVDSAAQQFEAIFVQMMVKSMRDAVPESGLFKSSQADFYQSMLDKQWSQVVASRGMGLADALVDQLERQGAFSRPDATADADSETQTLIAGIPRGTPRVLDNTQPLPDEDTAAGQVASQGFLSELDAVRQAVPAADPVNAAADADHPPVSSVAPSAASDVSGSDPAERFTQTMLEPAREASRATGVPAELILAQAALETGWGQHEIRTESGQNSYNVFGIKAGSQWQGATTDIVTHEYIDGQRTPVTDTFRVYDSFASAFTDYASLIGDNPRYAGVVKADDPGQAARALQSGGYATDPYYADKLMAVMESLGRVSTDIAMADRR